MLVDLPELAPDLEWMLQSGQVSSQTLIETLAREHGKGVYRLAFALLGDARQAEAAVRTAFIGAAVERHRYRAAWGARPWVYRLALQAIRGGVRPAPDTPPLSVLNDPIQEVLAALDRLPAARRAAVYLEAAGLPPSELAFILGVRPQAYPDVAAEVRRSLASRLPEGLDPYPLLAGWLGGVQPPERDQEWLGQAAAEAAARERRRPLAVLGREFAFLGALLALLAVGYFGAQRLGLLPPATPARVVQVREIRVTATPAVVSASTPVGAQEVLPALPQAAAPTALPDSSYAILTGTLTIHSAFTQTLGWNQSGSLGLAGVLNYWGLERPPEEVLADLQPDPDDQTVLAYELLAYVQDHTPYRALLRFGGDADLLARLVRAGFPVLIERYDQPLASSGWVGRYEVVVGYDGSGAGRLGLWMPYQPHMQQSHHSHSPDETRLAGAQLCLPARLPCGA